MKKLLMPCAALIVLLLVGCDEFSLLDQFYRTAEPQTEKLSLSVQANSVRQGETVKLFPSGGTKPYSFGVLANDLFYTDQDPAGLGSVANQVYTAGSSIGMVNILVTDAAGSTASAEVAIIPPAPTGLTAAGGTGSVAQVDLRWTRYPDPSFISGLLIERSPDGATYTTVATPGISEVSHTDKAGGLKKGTTYYYRMFAVAATNNHTFTSLATPVETATTQ